ncbi:MAG: nickel pincer cofactor biosynthesis protein LarC [Frankiaceae bacterium]
MSDGARLAWLDCGAGASGDMLLGALVGAGVPLPTLQSAVDAIGVGPVRLTAHEVTRAGIAATKVDVLCTDDATTRTWRDVRALLAAAGLAGPVHALAHDAFARLAVAEAAVHRTDPDDVHFHEVGALDAIADVVGVAAGFVALGADRVAAGTVTVGSGTARGAHGTLPVPVPAVLELLRAAGAPMQGGPVAHEMCTPTGAALLATVVGSWGPMPAIRVDAVGAGAGERDIAGLPNALRLVVGAPAGTGAAPAEPAEALVLEANVDDLDPRIWPAVLAALLAAGASDAWLTPILMKKGRPAHTLSVLVGEDAAERVRLAMFRETSTIGLREARFGKRALDRETATVDVDGRPVRVKLARLDGEILNAQPEYDDVARAAQALHRPVKVVLAAAIAAAHAAGLVPGTGSGAQPGQEGDHPGERA